MSNIKILYYNFIYVRYILKLDYRIAGMEGKFQSQNVGDEGNTQNHINGKKNSMSLNVNGLWDVVPRLDHYRYY